eukprot:SAG22_NODE_328_length_12271_cov_9.681811_10_plen_199_part_00
MENVNNLTLAIRAHKPAIRDISVASYVGYLTALHKKMGTDDPVHELKWMQDFDRIVEVLQDKSYLGQREEGREARRAQRVADGRGQAILANFKKCVRTPQIPTTYSIFLERHEAEFLHLLSKIAMWSLSQSLSTVPVRLCPYGAEAVYISHACQLLSIKFPRECYRSRQTLYPAAAMLDAPVGGGSCCWSGGPEGFAL